MYSKKQINLVSNVLKKNKTNYWTGKECKLFEKEFSNYIGNKYALTLSNGSVALELALKSLRLKKNDEVLVTSRSFIISASCVVNLGLKPRFVDVDLNGNLSIEGIKKAYKKNVKAIIVVHLNGLSCDLDPILSFVKKKKNFLIEDCSQAHGAVYKGRKVGSFGDLSTWSFCQDKIISTGGEGGMISTNNKKFWLKLWSLKDHGKNFNSVFRKKHKIGFKWLHDDFGSNYRMTEMQATIGREQLKLLDKQVQKRNSIAKLYLKELKDYCKKFKIIKNPDFKCHSCPLKQKLMECNKCRHSFYRLNLYIYKNKINQLKLIKELNNKGISCGVGSCPEIYREKIFRKLKHNPKKRFLNSKLLGETSLAFVINPYKKREKHKSDIIHIKSILNKYL